MEYLRSLKKPTMDPGSEDCSRREVDSAHTELEYNSIEEQDVVSRGKPKSVNKASAQQDTYGPTPKDFMCKGLNSSLDGPNREVVHKVTSGSPQLSRPCRQDSCSEGHFNLGSQKSPALECRNPSCDCKTVTC